MTRLVERRTAHGRAGTEVEVRVRAVARGPVPDQVLWRGRLYVVRAVLDHWVEAGRWWEGPEVAALFRGGSRADAGGADQVDDREREWWRVEASAGRLAEVGVYDLAHEPAGNRWFLVRVHD